MKSGLIASRFLMMHAPSPKKMLQIPHPTSVKNVSEAHTFHLAPTLPRSSVRLTFSKPLFFLMAKCFRRQKHAFTHVAHALQHQPENIMQWTSIGPFGAGVHSHRGAGCWGDPGPVTVLLLKLAPLDACHRISLLSLHTTQSMGQKKGRGLMAWCWECLTVRFRGVSTHSAKPTAAVISLVQSLIQVCFRNDTVHNSNAGASSD